MHSLSHKQVLSDYSSGASGLPWDVDAATMLENFHSYAMALYRIGAAEAACSKRQRAAFRLAKWLFDMGDGARLSVSQQVECEWSEARAPRLVSDLECLWARSLRARDRSGERCRAGLE
jgi:hypothetical protein